VKKTLIPFFLFYLRFLSKIQLSKIFLFSKITKGKKPIIIGITGSAGKSTLMQAIEAVLEPRFKVKTSSSGNSETGLPLSILNLKIQDYTPIDWLKIAFLSPTKLLTNWQTYDYFIAEMGIDEPDEPKNMSYLLKIIRPQIGIILNITPVHSMQFDKTVSKDIKGKKRLKAVLQNITQEKAKLITSLGENDLAIINSDDPFLKPLVKKTKAKVLTTGQNKNNTLQIYKTLSTSTSFTATYQYREQKHHLKINGYALSTKFSETFALALLVGISQNINLKTSIENLEKNLHLPPSRSTILKGIKKTLIIDSSYNSSPIAAHSMLKLLSTAPRGKRVAILGDMRELGLQSAQEHRKLAKTAGKTTDLLILVGPQMKKYFLPELIRLSFPLNKVSVFPHYQAAIPKIKNIIRANQTILIKGSQNTIFLEEIVKSLIPSKTLKTYLRKNLICRQSPFWLQTKKNFLRSIAN